MAASFKMYVVKWFGPYKESDLPNDASNMIYLWTGKRKSNPSVKYCVPQYCGITGRGIDRFLDVSHKKDELMPKYRKCWIGKIIGGKRTTVKGEKRQGKIQLLKELNLWLYITYKDENYIIANVAF